MKHLKTYESIFKNLFKGKLEPKVGDFIIGDATEIYNSNLKEFIENNIGQIININLKAFSLDNKPVTSYTILYLNPPSDLVGGWFIDYNKYMKTYQPRKKVIKDINGAVYPLMKNQIKHFSKNKEDLEQILNVNKYNL